MTALLSDLASLRDILLNENLKFRAETVERAMRAIVVADDQLREELHNMSCQHGCGCGHPHCNRCADASQAREALAAWKEAVK